MNIQQLENTLRKYDGETPVYIKDYGMREYHSIRFILQHYDKDNKPYVLIIPEDDIAGEED